MLTGDDGDYYLCRGKKKEGKGLFGRSRTVMHRQPGNARSRGGCVHHVAGIPEAHRDQALGPDSGQPACPGQSSTCVRCVA